MDIKKKIRSFVAHPLRGVKRMVAYIRNNWRFGAYRWSDSIESTRHITCRYVYLGKNVRIGYGARIQGVTAYNAARFTPRIELADNVSIEQNIHLTSANRVSIGRNTAIAANVTITDIIHPYEDVNVPIERQDIEVKEVTIGSGCKVYNGAVILPGCHIGDHCVIGANAVVNVDIPSYSVAVGAPARIVKRYDAQLKRWIKV